MYSRKSSLSPGEIGRNASIWAGSTESVKASSDSGQEYFKLRAASVVYAEAYRTVRSAIL